MNEKRQKETGLEVNVGDLLIVLVRNWWIILLSGILAASVFLVGTKLFIAPKYQSVTKIFVLSQENGNYLTSTDIQLSSYLTKDYAELIKSRTVVDEVIERLELKMTPEKLLEMIHVQTKSDTRIVTIEVMHENPQLAQQLANAIREVSAKQIMNVMGVEAVNMVDEANLPRVPTSPNVKKNTLLGAAWGVLIAVALILLRHLMNDTIKTEEDVERYLNVSVLAAIPTNEPIISKKGGLPNGRNKVKKAKINGLR
jgi:capsular polysaccharide biosynthesis protein